MTHRAWIDGASRGNPGPAGFGVLFESADGREEIVGYLGQATNNVAEYAGLCAALAHAIQHQIRSVQLHSDSLLLVRQLNGEYKVKAPHLVPIFLHARELRRQIPSCDIVHVRREDNRDADRLANSAIDQRAPLPVGFELPGVEFGGLGEQ